MVYTEKMVEIGREPGSLTVSIEFQTLSKLEQGTSFPSQTLWLPNGACNSQQLQEPSFLLSQGLERHILLCLKCGMELEFSNRGLESRLQHHLNHILSSKKTEKFCSVILPQCLDSFCFLNNLFTSGLDRLMSRLIARVTGGKSSHCLFFLPNISAFWFILGSV